MALKNTHLRNYEVNNRAKVQVIYIHIRIIDVSVIDKIIN